MCFETQRCPCILRAEGCLYSYVRIKMGEMGGGKREDGGCCVRRKGIKENRMEAKVTENYSNDPTRK